ncbi:uncharacterized protein LOC125008950 [Mugil cephalus]|uniref:uncharacterized protein LOC125008950 n=1 Tax=Mugil cephalus TaxID=48193 RepID=UPI001FB76662|nr:uncharacterized protein LOC125008950 [Mugil cephalus]
MVFKRMFKFQPTEGTSAEHCCVPFCQATSKYNRVLSFHTFPADEETRQKWIAAIRRDNLTVRPHVRVCSRHFKKGDMREPQAEGRRRLLKKGAVPALFEWNNYSVPLPTLEFGAKREGSEEGVARSEEHTHRPTFLPDHAYASTTDPDAVAPTLGETTTIKEEQERNHVEEQTPERFGIHRFAASDKDILLFTRFASYDHLMHFWALIEPTLPFMINVTQAQRRTFIELSDTTHSLQQIDEMFLFLNYLALGLKQQDLADRYGIDQSTVSRIIKTWSNFLYIILGSVRIWLPVDKIVEHLPTEFMGYADTTVILDCIKLRCQCPSSSVRQSEVLSSHKSDCTVKGLIGVAPHGAVTFISPLCAGSMDDKQIVRESGILSLLTPGMAIMVNRGFVVDDLVPCKVYRRPLLSDRSQVPGACEVRETETIARLRVHVEHLLGKVKGHKFFDTEIPLQLFGNVNQLYAVACLLTNYENGPLVKGLVRKPV